MDAVMDLVTTVMASPWLYVVVAVVVAIDSVFPVVPGEAAVITAGAYAMVQDSPHALILLLVTISGALVGDITSHHIGRGAGPLTSRLRRSRAGDALFTWARSGLEKRGGLLIIGARFIPGGRTATSLASGMIGYPRPRFIGFSLIAATAWAGYNVGIGMLGGIAFRDQPLLGVVCGVGLALVIGIVLERLRVRRENRAQGTAETTRDLSAAEGRQAGPSHRDSPSSYSTTS
jgi:membrane protein DedA with SNARE-associated domain